MKLILQENGIEYASHDWSGAPPQVVIDNDLHYLRTAVQDSRVIYALVPAGQVARFGSFGGEIPIAAKPAPLGFHPEPIAAICQWAIKTGESILNSPEPAAPPPVEREACTVGMAEYQFMKADRDARLTQVQDLTAENTRLRASVLNQCADNLCWFSDPNVGRALSEPEFLESCRRYRRQIADESGEYAGGRTIAQLEAENERLREEQEALKVDRQNIGRENEKLRNTMVAHSNNVVQQLQLQVEELTRRLREVREQRNENRRIEQATAGRALRQAETIAELQASLDMRHKADRRAIARWREADPEHNAICMPDHADLCLWLLDLLDSSHAREENLQAAVAVAAEPSQPWWDATKRLAADLVGLAAGKEAELAELRTRRDELLSSNNRLVEEKRTLGKDNWTQEQERDRWKQAFGEEFERGGKVLRGLWAIREALDTLIPHQGRDDAATPLGPSAAGQGMGGRVEEKQATAKKDRGAGST